MKPFIKYLVENSTIVIVIISLVSLIIALIVKLIIKSKIELQDLIKILLGISTIITGVILIGCSIYPEFLKSLQNLQFFILLAGISLIYVGISSVFSKKSESRSAI